MFMANLSDFRKKSDQFFKELIHNKYVLASLLGDCLSEFSGLTREEVMEYLPLEGNGETVVGAKTELVSDSKGPIYLDSLFQIPSPEGELGLIVAVEGQGSWMNKGSLANRQLYYIGRLLDEQAVNEPNMETLYTNLRKNVCIWVFLSPSVKDRNSTWVHRFYRFRKGDEVHAEPSPLDKVEVIEVHLGRHGDEYGTDAIGMMSTLIDINIDEDEKNRLLREKFKINLTESFIKEANTVGALAEEYEMFERARARWEAEVKEERARLAAEIEEERARLAAEFKEERARLAAEVKEERARLAAEIEEERAKLLIEGRNEEREKACSIFADFAYKLCCEQGMSPEDAVNSEMLVPEYREIVLEKVLEKLGKTE